MIMRFNTNADEQVELPLLNQMTIEFVSEF